MMHALKCFFFSFTINKRQRKYSHISHLRFVFGKLADLEFGVRSCFCLVNKLLEQEGLGSFTGVLVCGSMDVPYKKGKIYN